MTSSFRIKLKLAPKPVAAEGSSKQEGQDGASSSTSSQKPVASTSKRKIKENKVKAESDEAAGGKRKRAAYSSSPESTRQSPSPRQEQQSSSIRGDASSLVGEDSDDEEEEDDSDEEDDEDEEEGEEGEDESGEEEVDELEDSPPPASSSQAGSPRVKRVKMVGGTPKIVMARSGRGGRVLAGAAAGAHRKKLGLSGESESPEASIKPSSSKGSSKKATDEAGSSKKRPTLLDDLPKPLDEMSLEEIDALPPSKRRKSLKLRGISGPGRGWRKGLKMDQRPLYGTDGETSSKHLQVAPSTPSSFSTSSKQRKTSLARDAVSASTPLRSESPYSRSSPAVGGNDAAAAATTSASGMATLKKRMAEELAQQKKQQQSTAAAISAAQAGEARAIKAIVKGAPTILPPNKVPGSFITITALDKTKKPARKWERREREVLSLGGRAWSSATWITREKRQFAPPPDPKAGATATAGTTLAGNSLAATRTATPVIAGAASGTATPIGASRLSGQGRGSATTAAHTSPVASLSPQQPIRASFLPPSKHASSGKTASIVDKNARIAPAIAASPSSKSSAAAAATTSDAARDWRGSSAAYTMANRGRGQ